MKSKIIVSLLLALVMLFTLAAPALAGRPQKGMLQQEGSETGTAKFACQATHDNRVKVTIVLKGGYIKNDKYFVFIVEPFLDETDPLKYREAGWIMTDSNGDARRYRGITELSKAWGPGTYDLKVYLVSNYTAPADSLLFQSVGFELTFK